jgi:hypothetical protein
MAQMAAKFKESKLGPSAPAQFPGNYYGKYASSSVGRELNKYTHTHTHYYFYYYYYYYCYYYYSTIFYTNTIGILTTTLRNSMIQYYYY